MINKPTPTEGQSSELTASLATSDDAACSPSDSDTPETDGIASQFRAGKIHSDFLLLSLAQLASERNHWKRAAKDLAKDYLEEGREKDKEITRLKLLLENDERMHHYQRGRASITGLVLKLRTITETGRLVVVVMTRLVLLLV